MYNSLTGNAAEFALGLKKSKSLLEVKLGGNPWTPDDIDVIIGCFKKKCFLTNVSLGEYKWLTNEQNKVYIKKGHIFNINCFYV